VIICAKMAELIEMLFGLWVRMGPRNHALDGGPVMLRNVAMAITFWLLMGYNFGCMIASDTRFDLANMTELSMCGGYVALCQITFTTCCTIPVNHLIT